MKLTALRSLSSYRKEGKAIKVLATNEKNEFSTDSESLRLTYVEVQLMIKSASQVFKETALKCRIKATEKQSSPFFVNLHQENFQKIRDSCVSYRG